MDAENVVRTRDLVRWLKKKDPSGMRILGQGFNGVQILGPLQKDGGREIIAECEIDG
jgi:hypothetical protein